MSAIEGTVISSWQVAPQAAQDTANFQLLSEFAAIGLWSSDAAGLCTYFNPYWQTLHQISGVQAIGLGWLQAVHPQDRDRATEKWHQGHQTAGPFEFEYRVHLPSGEVRIVRSVARVILGPDEAIQGYVGSVQDITELRATKRLLTSESARLAGLLDATGAAFVDWNVQTGAVIGNASWAKMTGHQALDPAHHTYAGQMETVHPDDRPVVIKALDDHFADPSQPFEFQIRKRHLDGHWVWLMVRGRVASYTADGKADKVTAVQFDISDQKAREQALRRSEALLAQTGEIAAVGGWELDLLTNRLTWTDQTCRIHGLEPGYVPVLEQAIDFYAPASRPLIRSAVEKGLKDGTPWDLELQLDRADDTRTWVRAVGAVDWANGRPVRLYGAFQDINDRVIRQNQIEADLHRIALATASGGIGVWELNRDTGVLHWDDRMYDLFGAQAGQRADPLTLWDAAQHPDDQVRVEAEVNASLAVGEQFNSEFRIILPDGTERKIRAMAELSGPGNNFLIGINWDVTATRQMAAELAAQSELLRITLRSIGDGVITTDAAGQVTWLNPLAERLTGWINDEAIGQPIDQVFQMLRETSLLPEECPVNVCLRLQRATTPNVDAILLSRDGTHFGIAETAAPIKDDTGLIHGAVLVFHDVTKERLHSGQMTWRATHDHLTGVKNRVVFEARIEQLLADGPGQHGQHAVMFLDLDQFKLVNDGCGHAAGDVVLQQVTTILSQSIREQDLLARVGGDEFGIILENCTIADATQIAQSICDQMKYYRYVHDGRQYKLGASIGLAATNGSWLSVAALVQAADRACAVAKASGRNRVHVASRADAALNLRQGEVNWADRLRQALDTAGFALLMQPVRPLAPGASDIHAEVLLRLMSPDGSFILPGVFMPAAERFNLATEIDLMVLGQTIAALASLSDLTAIHTISVNLSGRSIGDRGFHRQVAAMLRAAGPDICTRLSFDISETAAVAHFADATRFIKLMHDISVRVALEDFGAGVSSFGYLQALKVDSLKIDNQFLRDLPSDPMSDVTLRCFVAMAQLAGIPTLAGFIDQESVLAAVQALGVDFAQGHLIGRPIPMAEWLKTGRPPLV